jgi:hypothetical protein
MSIPTPRGKSRPAGQVAIDMEACAESPNHEAEMPNYAKAAALQTDVDATS